MFDAYLCVNPRPVAWKRAPMRQPGALWMILICRHGGVNVCVANRDVMSYSASISEVCAQVIVGSTDDIPRTRTQRWGWGRGQEWRPGMSRNVSSTLKPSTGIPSRTYGQEAILVFSDGDIYSVLRVHEFPFAVARLLTGEDSLCLRVNAEDQLIICDCFTRCPWILAAIGE